MSNFIWLLILGYDFKYVFCLLEHLLQRYFLFLVMLVVFWDFCCNFWMIVSYKCNHVVSWKFESSAIWCCVVIPVYFKGLQCPHLQAEVGTDFFFEQGTSIVFEYAINTTYKKKSLDTTVWIIYHQRHVSALWAEYTIVVWTYSITIYSSYHNCVFILNKAYKAKTCHWW